MNHIDELRIIQNVLSGSREQYELLVRENQTKVYNLALKMTGSREDALDISQEVFIKAYVSLSSFRGDSLFSSWVYRLTYNMCIDLSRKSKRRKTVPMVFTDKDEEDSPLEIPDEAHLPETELEKKELQSEISAAVCDLPEEYRKIFIMREFDGLSYEEIAKSLCISQGTVKSRLSRARKRIAQRLIASGTFEPRHRHKNQKGGRLK